MKEKILITGASGFVGSHLVALAKSQNFEVHAAVRKSSQIEGIRQFVDQFVYPDFTSTDHLRRLLEQHQYTYIVHAAALTRAKNEADLFRVNVDYTLHFVRAAFEADIPLKRLVFVSSLAAIGPVRYTDPAINENNSYQPVTAYGRSKAAAEHALGVFDHFPLTIIRPTAVYGPREKDLFVLFKTLNSGLDAYIGRNEQKLSFIHVQDLVQCIMAACVVQDREKQLYNISDGASYSKYAMAEIFKQTLHKKPLRIHLNKHVVATLAKGMEWMYRHSAHIPVLYPERLNELTAENWACDISKAQTQLNFKASFPLAVGLKQTLMWYKEHKWL